MKHAVTTSFYRLFGYNGCMCCMINISNLANVSEKETNERAGDKKWVGCGGGVGEGGRDKRSFWPQIILPPLSPSSLPPNLNQLWSFADNFTTKIRVVKIRANLYKKSATRIHAFSHIYRYLLYYIIGSSKRLKYLYSIHIRFYIVCFVFPSLYAL